MKERLLTSKKNWTQRRTKVRKREKIRVTKFYKAGTSWVTKRKSGKAKKFFRTNKIREKNRSV